MKAVVGVFKSRSDAEIGAAELVRLHIPRHRVTILTPHASDQAIAAVPTVAGEQPGMGKAIVRLWAEPWALQAVLDWCR
jgi:hypothetical protein